MNKLWQDAIYKTVKLSDINSALTYFCKSFNLVVSKHAALKYRMKNGWRHQRLLVRVWSASSFYAALKQMYVCINEKLNQTFFGGGDFTSQEDETFRCFVSAGNLYTECFFSLLFGPSLRGQNFFFIECFVLCWHHHCSALRLVTTPVFKWHHYWRL